MSATEGTAAADSENDSDSEPRHKNVLQGVILLARERPVKVAVVDRQIPLLSQEVGHVEHSLSASKRRAPGRRPEQGTTARAKHLCPRRP